ncbi:MAG TPA: hypothetical protein VGP95_04670 [Gemmatimonadaceae bacterium]|jgi:hypothetical protein|nr:hypothetical protein [Gemmatimonadaceae bacterium]
MATSATGVGRTPRLRRLGRYLAFGSFVLGASCHPPSGTAPRRLDRSLITREEMLNGNYVSVYDAVAALRSIWLRPRTSDSNTNVVWVYVDGSRVGDVGVLKEMQPRLVNTVRFYDGPSATSRWGVDHAAGVIHVSTWSEGAGGLLVPDSTRPKPPKPPPTP